MCLTLLFVQQEVAVLVATSDGVRDAVSVRVVGVNDGNQRVWTRLFTQEGLIADGQTETVSQKQSVSQGQTDRSRQTETVSQEQTDS